MGASGIVSGTLTGSMAITSADWTNNGLIVFYQNQRSSGNVNLGTPLGKITNDGQICLYNQVYRQLTEIQGSGCITADEDSTIYIGNGLLGISTAHNFYLNDTDSSLVAPAISRSQTFNVYGFGNGNKIGLTLPLAGSILPLRSAYSYDTSTGILTLRNVLLVQYFNIGLGYNPSLFQIVTDSGAGIPSTILGSVRYNGPVPERTLPAACQIACRKAREVPGVDPTEYLTTVTSTLSDGSVTTESGIVDETTDSQGSWYTTTSLFPPLSSSSSEVVSSSSEIVSSTERESSLQSFLEYFNSLSLYAFESSSSILESSSHPSSEVSSTQDDASESILVHLV